MMRGKRQRIVGFIHGVLRKIFLPMDEWKSLRAAFFAVIFSAALLRFAFPPFGYCFIAWIGLAPLIVCLHNRTAKQGAWLGLVFGIVYYYLNLTWLNSLCDYHLWVLPGVFAVAVACAIFSATFGALTAWILQVRIRGHFLFVPALWVLLEALRSTTELGFPWFYLGHTQAIHTALIQITSLSGVWGLSFLIVTANVAVADTCLVYLSRVKDARCLVPQWLTVFLLLGFALLFGARQLAYHPPESSTNPNAFRVALIQPGVSQRRKLESYTHPDRDRRFQLQTEMLQGIADQILAIRTSLETAQNPLPDLYILPEAVVTELRFNLILSLVECMRERARIGGAPVLFGANRYVPPTNARPGTEVYYNQGEVYNSVYLSDPENGVNLQHVYDKMHLVPFSECASYFDIIPGFARYILNIKNFTPGTAPRIFEVGGRHLGPLVCFESCFPHLFRQYVRRGVDAVVVLTNDAWYGPNSGPERHYTQSIFRAVESQRPVIRVANTGISAIIDARGREVVRLPLREDLPLQICGILPSASDTFTLYMRFGPWFVWLCLLYNAVYVFYTGYTLRRRNYRGFRDPPDHHSG